MKQKDLNNFRRKYFDLTKNRTSNAIIHDSNTCYEHRHVIIEICEWLRENKMVFYTRVYTNYGEIVDIVAPELPRPFIEVRHSELKKEKLYKKEYDHLRVFIDCADPFKLL